MSRVITIIFVTHNLSSLAPSLKTSLSAIWLWDFLPSNSLTCKLWGWRRSAGDQCWESFSSLFPSVFETRSNSYLYLDSIHSSVPFSFSDIGFGNYVLTAPDERNGKSLHSSSSSPPRRSSTASSSSSQSHRSRSSKLFHNPPPMTKYDVSELLGSSNTLTNPNAYKKTHKTELWARKCVFSTSPGFREKMETWNNRYFN